MIVHLSPDAPPRIDDVDRFDRLHVVCDGPPTSARLGGLATPTADDDHVWLSITELRAGGREVAVRAGVTDFDQRFDAMIEFASRHDWLDETGTRVRAHVERPAAT